MRLSIECQAKGEFAVSYHYMPQGEVVWSFDTAQFVVRCSFTGCIDDPADSFCDERDIEAVRNGDVLWFDAFVRVTHKETGAIVGEDSLGACAYAKASDFLAGHRDADPMNRNCSIMRASRGGNVCIGHYFPDMVRQAVSEARRRFGALSSVKLRATA